MKIHISASTKILLDIFGSFTMEERGTISVKVRKDLPFLESEPVL